MPRQRKLRSVTELADDLTTQLEAELSETGEYDESRSRSGGKSKRRLALEGIPRND